MILDYKTEITKKGMERSNIKTLMEGIELFVGSEMHSLCIMAINISNIASMLPRLQQEKY